MKSIHNILPTIDTDDVLFFLSHFFSNSREWSAAVAKKLNEHFPNSSLFLFNSGREALEFIAIHGLNPRAEIYTQAFTCSAVVYPFLKHGFTPIYIDIDTETFNMSYEDLLKKQTTNAGALLLQYTFGLIPKKREELIQFARKNNLVVIEDLAHAFGTLDRNVGMQGDFTVLSFGRDKVVSSVKGGALLVHNTELAKKLQKHYVRLSPPNFFSQLKLAFYLVFMGWAKNNYEHKLTRGLIFLLQQLGLLDKSVSKKEMAGIPSGDPIRTISPLMLPLLYHQLGKMNQLNKKRAQITTRYNTLYHRSYTGDLLKYPLLVPNPDSLISKARKQHAYLDTWYGNVIDPVGVDMKKYGYIPESCQEAEYAAAHVINLPTLYPLTTVQIAPLAQ